MTIFSFMHVVWTLLAEKSKLLCCLHNHLALLLLLLAPVNLGQSETQVLFPCVIILPLIGVFFLKNKHDMSKFAFINRRLKSSIILTFSVLVKITSLTDVIFFIPITRRTKPSVFVWTCSGTHTSSE